MNNGFVIAIKKEYNKEEEIYGEAPTERLAISRADRIYTQMILDTVAVIEVDRENGITTVPYKRVRKCKHTNIQFLLKDEGIVPVCESCGLVILSRVEEIKEE